MEIKNLKKLCISHLILIIDNKKEDSFLRKYAEIELRSRIKNMYLDYYDILHFDDKVINIRGIELDNYLLSPKTNLQKLMETYFLYDYDCTFSENNLLFSEKHLCNEANFCSPFFSKICSKEIKHINNRLDNGIEDNKKTLLEFKQLLEDRETRIKEMKRIISLGSKIELVSFNESCLQLESLYGIYLKLNQNITDEKYYSYHKNIIGNTIFNLEEKLSYLLYNYPLIQNFYGLKIALNDSKLLNSQKRLLMTQANNNYVVNYNTESMQKALLKIKK